jgi:hypothetical protein
MDHLKQSQLQTFKAAVRSSVLDFSVSCTQFSRTRVAGPSSDKRKHFLVFEFLFFQIAGQFQQAISTRNSPSLAKIKCETQPQHNECVLVFLTRESEISTSGLSKGLTKVVLKGYFSRSINKSLNLPDFQTGFQHEMTQSIRAITM